MRELIEKIQKVKPLKRARKAQLDQQSTELSKIRKMKADLLDDLETTQRAYIEGVDELNRQRQSSFTGGIEVYERGLDYVKDKWYGAMAEVRKVEREEQLQLAQVISAQKNLKAVAALEEKYSDDLRFAERQSEQNQMDEISSRMNRTKS